MKNNLPVILLNSLVLLPTQEVKIELNNEITRKVVSLSSKYHDNQVLVVIPMDQYEEQPDINDLPRVGVVGKIKSKTELPNGNLRIIISGYDRVFVHEYLNYHNENDVLDSIVSKIDMPKLNEIEEKAILRKLDELLNKYISSSPSISNSVLSSIKGITEIDKLTDMIAIFLPFEIDKKIAYMCEINPLKRAESLIKDINLELEVIELDKKIDNELKEVLDNSQKEYIIKERIKLLNDELGINDSKEIEVNKYRDLLDDLEVSEKTRNKINLEIDKFKYMNDNSPELANVRNYLDVVLNLPWNKSSDDNDNISKILKHLNETHYGLDDVKNKIIEFIVAKKRNNNINSPVICLVGPPGIGKTTLSHEIAISLNREFYKISVGGLNDSAELLGHRRTYLGAKEGKIIQGIRKCNTNNPVILIDEIDKMVKDYKGDPASVLLDILDINQNKSFIDNYIEEPFDLSNVIFITTSNSIDDIPNTLLDRLDIIELNSYTLYDKLNIANNYLLKSIYDEHKISNYDVKFSENGLITIINDYTMESGVRDLRRKLVTIVRKVLVNKESKIIINELNVSKYLGMSNVYLCKYDNNYNGVCNLLCTSIIGGNTSIIECSIYTGIEKVLVTGNASKIMVECINTGLGYIRSNLKLFHIKDNYFNNVIVHINFNNGLLIKNGSSAGVGVVVAILSKILNKGISNDIAFTGEITLNGEVLSVGSIKEKIIGAIKNNIKIIYLPSSNINDIKYIDNEIIKQVEIRFVNNFIEIYNDLFK